MDHKHVLLVLALAVAFHKDDAKLKAVADRVCKSKDLSPKARQMLEVVSASENPRGLVIAMVRVLV